MSVTAKCFLSKEHFYLFFISFYSAAFCSIFASVCEPQLRLCACSYVHNPPLNPQWGVKLLPQADDFHPFVHSSNNSTASSILFKFKTKIQTFFFLPQCLLLFTIVKLFSSFNTTLTPIRQWKE